MLQYFMPVYKSTMYFQPTYQKVYFHSYNYIFVYVNFIKLVNINQHECILEHEHYSVSWRAQQYQMS